MEQLVEPRAHGREVGAATWSTAIEASKRTTARRASSTRLGIPQVGEHMAAVLAEHFGSARGAASGRRGRAAGGPRGRTRNGARDPRLLQPARRTATSIARLLQAGVQPRGRAPRRAAARLAGKTFVLTGALSVPRDEVARLIAAARRPGHRRASARSTDYVVAGDGPGLEARQGHDASGCRSSTSRQLRKLLQCSLKTTDATADERR